MTIRKLADIERDEIVRALTHFGGSKPKAAAALGISVRSIQLKINEYDLVDFHEPRGRARKQRDFLDRLIIRR